MEPTVMRRVTFVITINLLATGKIKSFLFSVLHDGFPPYARSILTLARISYSFRIQSPI